MLLVVLLFVVPVQGVRHGFQASVFTEWKDCGVGDSWVSVNQFDFRPDSFDIHLEFTTSFDATITHSIADQVTLDVLIEKKLLGRYTRVPCMGDFGSCHYTDPCQFLNKFKQHGTCPVQLTANGIPCTCPFNPDRLLMPMTKFSIYNLRSPWKYFLSNADYYLKITINEKRDQQLRGCFEAYLSADLDEWVLRPQLEINPSPIKLPGDIIVSFDGFISQDISNNFVMDILMEKSRLNGGRTKVPCMNNFGTCHYTDPCSFLNSFKQNGVCPDQFIENGIPCSCPFKPGRFHMSPTKFTVSSLSSNWLLILDGSFNVKITIADKSTHQQRGFVETNLNITIV
ncbi:uncharacterized protein [Haliotis asinina]|uniref:uncharacterized protein n=1 Tax=Haliotis asinina TaxID=109174 RepID=UPI003531BB06